MPCDNAALRAEVAQRPTFQVTKGERLGDNVEAELTYLFEKEIALHRVTEDMRQ